MAVRRGFGIAADTVAGGSSYDDLTAGAIPDATEFWPVTGGTVDKNITRIDRNDEVRGRRAATPPLSFGSEPVITVPVPGYLSIWARLWALARARTYTPVGTAPAPVTHPLRPLEYGSDSLPKQVHAQLIRDAHNHKLSGSSLNRVSMNFPLDGEATGEVELAGLYMKDDPAAIPSIAFSGLSSRPLVLRDAQVFFDAGSEVQRVTGGVGITAGTWTLTVPANTVGVTPGTASGIAYTATAAALQTALEAIVGVGNVTVTGGPLNTTTPYTISFVGAAAGRDVPQMTTNSAGLTGGSATATTFTAGGSPVLDLQGFEISFNNNLAAKRYARRNRVVDGTDILWFPEQRKLGAAQEITGRINFGNVQAAQEAKHDFSKAQKIVFEAEGPALGTTPAANELLRITIYAGVLTGGGPEALSARDDITASYEFGAFYSEADAADILVEPVVARETSYLSAGL